MNNHPEKSSQPTVDKYGLPLDSDIVTPVASSPHNSLGEPSNNRSVGMSFLPPPKLYSQSVLSGPITLSCPMANLAMLPSKINSATMQKSELTSTLTKLCSSPLSSGTWNLPLRSIKPKPHYYTLDQMSTIIMDSDAQSIATRISVCLRRRSILAIYGETKAKAKCVSTEGVEFRIKLFAGKDRFSKGVIVEVQRRNNWSSTYFQDCRAILESAKRDYFIENEHPQKRKYLPSSCFEDEPEDNTKLQLVKLLLSPSNPSMESAMFALHSLNSLTDSQKCGRVRALSTAKAIFMDEENENKDVRDLLYNITIKEQIRTKNTAHVHCTDEAMRRCVELAFTSIARSILILAEEVLLCDVLSRNGWVESDLIDVFMKQVQSHTSHPQSSVLASKCMIAITNISSKATNAAIDLGILNILQPQPNVR